MDKIMLVQRIGNEVCEGCGPDCDCGEIPQECFRVNNAVGMLNEFLGQTISQSGVAADGNCCVECGSTVDGDGFTLCSDCGKQLRR